jgi:AcrR family transcriptional regulator
MDKRIEKTLVKIRDGLLSLVAEKDIADISVAELSRAAGIDRKTFYLHYKTVDDALEALCDYTVQEVTAGFKGELVSDIKSLYDYLNDANENLYLLISGEKSGEFRTLFMHGVFTSEAFGEYYKGADHCLIEGYLYSILYIYEKCRLSGRSIDTSELAQMAASLIEHGIKNKV